MSDMKTCDNCAHADLAIRKTPSVGREEYLDHMTFRSNKRSLLRHVVAEHLSHCGVQ